MSTGRVWSRASRALAVVSLVAASATVGVVLAPSAVADGPTTFSNSSAIAIPATGSPNQIGTASPYPSSVNVSGMTGAVTKVTVAFNGLTHGTVNDVDAMVVAPTGANLVVLSDAGSDALIFASNATLTFDDAAAGTVPSGNVPTGTLPADQCRRRHDRHFPPRLRRRRHRPPSRVRSPGSAPTGHGSSSSSTTPAATWARWPAAGA